MTNPHPVVCSERAIVRIVASTMPGVDGTGMSSATPRPKAAARTDITFDGSYVGSPAWSPPV